MNFIDRTGHIFSLPSYDSFPIGYEYSESPYIFWFDTEKGYKLSVNNYYFKPIRVVTRVKEADTVSVNIKIENSNKFYLIDSDIIENRLLSIENINNSISLFEEEITSSQELDYTESFDLINESLDMKGCLVDETPEDAPLYCIQTYYLNTLSNSEYTGDIISWDDFNGEYLGSDGNYHSKEEVSEDSLFGVIEIGMLKREVHVLLDKSTREVEYDSLSEEEKASIENTYKKKELYLINTFYVVVNSPEQGTWSTNVLVRVNDEWCPVTIAAEIMDENEELIINGQNLGVSLPKEIVQAIYTGNYNISISDEKLYYLKLKEYLMNFMSIKGEMGNYKSVLLGLKWFEWDNMLSISKLLRNDNRVQRQYVKDFFELINDNLYSYQLFKNTSLLSLTLDLDEDLEQEKQYINDKENHYFWGEGKYSTANKFNYLREVRYDEKEYPYMKGYFDFTFNDLGLKLAALKYYYETYFLPLYIRVHKIYMNKHVYANDIKFITKTSNGITATPVYFSTNNEIIDQKTHEVKDIVFNNDYDIVFFNRNYKKDTTHNELGEEPEYAEFDSDGNVINYNLLFVDKNFNEFSHYTYEYVHDANNEETFYEINDTSLRIPIEFPHNIGEYEYYNVSLILSKYINSNNDSIVNEDSSSNLRELLSTNFSFIQTDSRMYKSLVIYPKIINELNSNKFDSNYWLNNIFRIDMIVNNKLYEFKFRTKMPEFNIELGKLIYKYDYEKFKQKGIEYLDSYDAATGRQNHKLRFNAYMYLPNLVNVNNMDFDRDVLEFSNNLSDYIQANYKENLKFLNRKYLNWCHLIDLYGPDGKPVKYEYFDSNIKAKYFNSLTYDSSTKVIDFYDNTNEKTFSIGLNKLIKLKDTDTINSVVMTTDNDLYCVNISTTSLINKKYKVYIEELCKIDNIKDDIDSTIYEEDKIQEEYFNSLEYNSSSRVITFYNKDEVQTFNIGINELIEVKPGDTIISVSLKYNYVEIEIRNTENKNHKKYIDDLYNEFFSSKISTLSWDDLQLFIDINNATDINLYNAFFKDYIDESTGEDRYDYAFDENLIKINGHRYDLFLMHDFSRWYIILISKECIDFNNEKDKKFKFGNGKKEINIGDYKLKYNRSDRKFLLNRYYYESAEGVNHFKTDDLIVASLKNNDKLCLKLAYGSKWNIYPITLGLNNMNTVSSNSELGIISIPDKYSEYQRGYYSLNIEYAVDDYIEHTYIKRSQFRIDN